MQIGSYDTMATSLFSYGVYVFMGLGLSSLGPAFFTDPSEASARQYSSLGMVWDPWKQLQTPTLQVSWISY
jgi:hypothetical protein